MAFHEIGGRCYFYGYFPLNWYRASEFCHSFGKGVSLACIESAKENFHIKQWLGVNGKRLRCLVVLLVPLVRDVNYVSLFLLCNVNV